MRWLIAVGLAVAACSGSGSKGSSSPSGEAGDGGDASGGTAAKPGSAGSSSSAGAHAGEGGSADAGAPTRAGESGAGTAGGAGGADPDPAAGQGGELVAGGAGGESGGGSPPVGGNASGSSGSAGTGGTNPKPDPCEGVLPWDPAVPYTELKKDELRTLRGELWKCSSPAFCTTYPGHETAPGWMKVDECDDPNEGGEPACQCKEGACCDGCYFRPRSHFCEERPRSFDCNVYTASCSVATDDIRVDYWNVFCSGDTGGECARWGAHTRYEFETCPASTKCIGSTDASCVACN